MRKARITEVTHSKSAMCQKRKDEVKVPCVYSKVYLHISTRVVEEYAGEVEMKKGEKKNAYPPGNV